MFFIIHYVRVISALKNVYIKLNTAYGPFENQILYYHNHELLAGDSNFILFLEPESILITHGNSPEYS